MALDSEAKPSAPIATGDASTDLGPLDAFATALAQMAEDGLGRSARAMRWPHVSGAALQTVLEGRVGRPVAVVHMDVPHLPKKRKSLLDLMIAELLPPLFRLFPAWLPEAAAIEGPGGAGLAAVEAVARARAGRSALFGPFLTTMARAALAEAGVKEPLRFHREVIVREAAKLVELAYGGAMPLLILSVPAAGTMERAEAVEAAALWIAGKSGFRVWVAGPGADQMPRLPEGMRGPPSADNPVTGEEERAPTVTMTGLEGRPNPASDIEHRLKARLDQLPWAAGGRCGWPWRLSSNGSVIRVDLAWPEDWVVVEIDGRDHRDPIKFEADRRRDRLLQRAGFAVYRFTNRELEDDLERVLAFLEETLAERRASMRAGSEDGGVGR